MCVAVCVAGVDKGDKERNGKIGLEKESEGLGGYKVEGGVDKCASVPFHCFRRWRRRMRREEIRQEYLLEINQVTTRYDYVVMRDILILFLWVRDLKKTGQIRGAAG